MSPSAKQSVGSHELENRPMKPRSKPLRRSPLSRVSKKRRKEMDLYSTKRKAFLAAHPWCQVWLKERGLSEYMVLRDCGPVSEGRSYCPLSVDIHHMNGRTGWRLNDESEWLAVSREAHERIHQNPSWARERGYLK